jgi:hypothetical protein
LCCISPSSMMEQVSKPLHSNRSSSSSIYDSAHEPNVVLWVSSSAIYQPATALVTAAQQPVAEGFASSQIQQTLNSCRSILRHTGSTQPLAGSLQEACRNLATGLQALAGDSASPVRVVGEACAGLVEWQLQLI